MSDILTPRNSDEDDEDLPVYPGGVLNARRVIEYFGSSLLLAGFWASIGKLLVSDQTWGSLLAWWEPYADVWLFIIIMTIIHAVIYYVMNFTYLAFHYYKIFEQYQLPRSKGQPFPDRTKLLNTIWEGSISHFTSLPIGGYVLFYLIEFHGGSMSAPLPSWWTMLWQIYVSMITLDFTFYWAHRWFHTPEMYKRFHKKHHEYKWTIGFAAEWAHPFEHLVANEATMALGPILMGVHGYTWFVWLAYRLAQTFQGHSGYAFPYFFHSTKVHDFHHTQNVGNYSHEFMDTLFGTNDLWVLKNRKELAAKMKKMKN